MVKVKKDTSVEATKPSGPPEFTRLRDYIEWAREQIPAPTPEEYQAMVEKLSGKDKSK